MEDDTSFLNDHLKNALIKFSISYVARETSYEKLDVAV